MLAGSISLEEALRVGVYIEELDIADLNEALLSEATEQNCIIVVDTSQDARKFSIGIVVDRVREVLDIAGEVIEEAPQFRSSVNNNFILGMMGNTRRILCIAVVFLSAVSICQAEDKGIEVALGLTNIYQQNVRGGMSTHNQQGAHTGSYDLELTNDLQTLLGIEGASLYVHAEGSWSRADIDATSVGSVFGANRDAGGRRAMDVTELWYEQAMFDESVFVRLGKLDITGGFECRGCPGSFDGGLYANDETGQFLNGALVNNPTIPFPDFGLGAIVHWNPIEWWYTSAGVIDAQADGRETGFRTAFHKEDYFFYVLETGITPQLDSANGPLQGAYRIGVWNDAQPKANSDAAKNRRDDVGFYLSCDQMLCKENNNPEDTQGLGTFFRYGYANDERNDITNFWSAGFQYQGLLEDRDDDVLGVGFAQGVFSDKASMTYTEDYESVVEAYYNVQVTPWWNISPGVQYIANPGGVKTTNDAVIVGVRSQMAY